MLSKVQAPSLPLICEPRLNSCEVLRQPLPFRWRGCPVIIRPSGPRRESATVAALGLKIVTGSYDQAVRETRAALAYLEPDLRQVPTLSR